MNKRRLFALPSITILSLLASSFSYANVANINGAKALVKASPTAISLPKTINLNDASDNDVRNYYSSLNSLDEAELKGTNLLKNLKPILQNMTFITYENVWKAYEITDREWALSPEEEISFGTYDAATRTYSNYQYSTSNTSTKNNPYVRTLYRNRDENGVTIESGRIREWGDHTQNGGTNREHVWPKSHGFKNNDEKGPAFTDLHHLLSGDGAVNNMHSNYCYGEVDLDKSYESQVSKYAFTEGNYLGTAKNYTSDQKVFEPQDSDKGDIARAVFYMAACYNNYAGDAEIDLFNPNLAIVDYVTDGGPTAGGASSKTEPAKLGLLSDLLTWHWLDPVDEYEIHRNNLIFNNYQNNRNPFIDFPEWVDYIWGENSEGKYAKPETDRINFVGEEIPLTGISLEGTKKEIEVGGTGRVEVTFTPKNATNKNVTYSSSDSSIISVNSAGLMEAKKEGKVTITVISEEGGFVATIEVTAIKRSGPNFILIGIIAAAVIVVLIIVVIIMLNSKNKKVKKIGKKIVKYTTKSVKKSTRKSPTRKK